MNRKTLGLILVGLFPLAGCSSTLPSTGPLADCPTPEQGSSATVDFVDFVQFQGRQYLANQPLRRHRARIRSVSAAALGRRELTVRCSFAQLNEQTRRMTPQPRDGDAAFLTPGTPVYAIHGWSPRCRLAASHDGRLYVYLAYLPQARVATPASCALRRNPQPRLTPAAHAARR